MGQGLSRLFLLDRDYDWQRLPIGKGFLNLCQARQLLARLVEWSIPGE